MKDVLIYKYEIKGSRTLSNLIFFILLLFGSLYFFSISYNSYFYSQDVYSKADLVQTDLDSLISFFPQGLVMGFYSFFGLFLSYDLLLGFIFNIGYGYNEFNRKEKIVRIFRWGYPGENRRVEACFSFDDLKSIKILLGSKNILYLSLKGDSDIPLTREGFFESLDLLEEQATDIAQFIGIPLVYI
ncbi:Ycf4 protein (plastid) [Lotharella oceanica]|uniref:Photosystem I assembly protein Ycf4 n=1 Tax=Lotharella oceanica TaxID=641309 RepID=A0A059SLX1_9EUKA|nr:Ycf4 protein [Lotharella oceanica]